MKISFWPGLMLAGAAMCALAMLGLGAGLDARPAGPAPASRAPRCSRTLIIDPGHGGADGGAVSVTGASESGINLDIAKKARLIAAFFGVDTVMTRESEDIDYPDSAGTIHAKKVADTKARVALAGSVDNAVFLSIHQNKYTSASPNGPQVFFAPTEDSQELAGEMQELLIQGLQFPKDRPAKRIPDTIYIMNAVKCPAVLVECGFLSNPADAAALESPEHQTKLAAIMVGAFLGHYT